MAEPNNNSDMLLEDNGIGGGDESLSAPEKGAIASFFSNVDVLRQISMIIGLLIVLAIVVILWSWGKEEDYRPLGSYKTDELITTLDYLDTQKIVYKIEGNSILVIAGEYQKIKLLMTRAGLGEDNVSNGDDILLQDMGFGISQRVEQERLKLSRERQLVLAIQAMKNITKAQVLLAIPKQSVFARKERQASATVVVTSGNSYSLSPQEVDSIVDIVASAVQGLSPNSVTVSDQRGRLLHSGSKSGMSARSSKEFALEQEREEEYKSKVDAILIPVLGLANYTSEVDLAMDFTIIEETKKSYNPANQAVRSEMLVETKSTSSTIGNVPGALTNQPPANGAIPEELRENNIAGGNDGNSHNESTRNYEVDTTVTHIKHKVGKIDRLAVSVALDYTPVTNAAGEVTYIPRADEEVESIRRLLMGGLGINAERGDILEIASVKFNRPDLEAIAEEEFWKTEAFEGYVRFGGSMLVILLTLLLIVRPIMKKLLYPEALEQAEEYDLGGAIGSVGGDNLQLLNDDEEDGVQFDMSSGSIKLPNLHKDEDLLKAVRALVANEPGLSAQVIKEWLVTDDG
ncbi:flagellar basal-body MS-ring/collar protein FliF [Psychromonas sp. Urea-02u-13]|uniref:flagellar basal-body MS-ring/collar protein FliF n=1 Tax=Psychromonas sp. Urea-02u-13 TaxID=2058326 RepID=UPI000C340AAA|nr:flagellar basal-body MS-ring/collar protein FliF [Psychromonas sp. Urea-02u-13]PKG39847.1 flagellar basal body M-ring protein FliF [Psychromonas sp. Urea-02u-13]